MTANVFYLQSTMHFFLGFSNTAESNATRENLRLLLFIGELENTIIPLTCSEG